MKAVHEVQVAQPLQLNFTSAFAPLVSSLQESPGST
jgi:hypothetical protein